MNRTAAIAILAVCALLPLGAFGAFMLVRVDPATRDQAYRAAEAWSVEAAEIDLHHGETSRYELRMKRVQALQAHNPAALRHTIEDLRHELEWSASQVRANSVHRGEYLDRFNRWRGWLADMKRGL